MTNSDLPSDRKKLNDHPYDYDFIVLGAGSGGVRASRIAASHGAKVALIEKQHLGGTCVNVGCVPKKIYAYSSEIPHEMEDAVNGYGWSLDKMPQHDWATLKRNKDAEINRLQGIYGTLLKDVTVYEGHGSFIDDHCLEVNGQKITGDRILIATGGTPQIPNIPGKEHFMNSDDMFYIEDRPENFIVYGGGYIGVEFAGIMAGHGSNVTLIYRGDMFLRGFDDDIRAHLAKEMLKNHINLKFNLEITKIEKISNQQYKVHLSSGDVIETNAILAATGRVSNIDSINLSSTGVEVDDKKMIPINDDYQTNIPHIYAVGDITTQWQLTPVAIAQAHHLVDSLFAPKDHKCAPKPHLENVPTAVFSNPPIGTVGMTESQAIKEYGIENIECFTSSFRALRYTLPKRDAKSFLKLVVRKTDDVVLGVHMTGYQAAEIVQGFALAVDLQATKAHFDRMIGVHPTSGEEYFTMRTARPAKINNNLTLKSILAQ